MSKEFRQFHGQFLPSFRIEYAVGEIVVTGAMIQGVPQLVKVVETETKFLPYGFGGQFLGVVGGAWLSSIPRNNTTLNDPSLRMLVIHG